MIIIDAKRWFQTLYGNTYHSVRVYIDSKLIGECLFTYGYGEQYLQSAFDILAENGIFPYEKTKELVTVNKGQGTREYQTPKESINKNEAYHQFIQDMRDNRDKYHITCVDVSRRKDL